MHDTTVYTLSGVCGETLASEMLANRWAVQVLRVWDDSERQAVQATVLHLLALQRLRGDWPGWCRRCSLRARRHASRAVVSEGRSLLMAHLIPKPLIAFGSFGRRDRRRQTFVINLLGETPCG